MRTRALVGWTAGTALVASATGYLFGWVALALSVVLGAVGLIWSLLDDSRQGESGGRFAAKVMQQRWKAERDVTPGL